MRHASRITVTAAAITVLVAAGVAGALAATPSRSGPSVPVASAPGGWSPARLGNVSCGQTLTESTILANDLTNCGGDGLVVGADGITVFGRGIGILVAGTEVTAANNTVKDNDVGINADGDVSGGGGNTATGNGSLHQCENVVCIEP